MTFIACKKSVLAKKQSRRNYRSVSAWLLLDKPKFISSTKAVTQVKHLFQAKKAGHAGTLDPLASGLLPIALGEATKTVSYVLEGKKTYQFSICWGSERTSDDLEGEIVCSSDKRPSQTQIEACLENFHGTISQTPPKFSAVKIDGERAYKLARNKKDFKLEARNVIIYDFRLLKCESENSASFEVCCSKGTYIRSLARDLGRKLGCYGHVSELRRTDIFSIPPSYFDKIVSLETLLHYQNHSEEEKFLALDNFLLPCETPLYYMPSFSVNGYARQKLLQGQKISLDHPHIELCQTIPGSQGLGLKQDLACEKVKIFYKQKLLALGEKTQQSFQPKRIFHLSEE